MELQLVSPTPTRRLKLPERVSLSAGHFPLIVGREASSRRDRHGTKITLDPSISGISRDHCKIDKAPPGSPHNFVISDNGSSNGTALRSNGVAVRVGSTQVPLRVGQELLLGCCGREVKQGQRLPEPVRACVVYKVVEAAPAASASSSNNKRPRGSPAASEPEQKRARRAEAPPTPPQQQGGASAQAQGGGGQDELGEEDQRLYSLLACSVCMEMPATAAHLSCGHVMCFTCAHGRFFHQSVEDASAYGFQDRIRQCPIDRKTVTHVSRALVVDSLVDEFNRRPVPMVKADEREAWEARRKDGQELATYYDTRLKGNPRNLIAMPYTQEVSLVLAKTKSRRGAKPKCDHCWEALVADEAEVRYDTGLRTGRNATGKVHLRCVREAVIAAVRAGTPLHQLVRFTFLGRTETPGRAQQDKLKDEIAALRQELDSTKHALPWWVEGRLELAGTLFTGEAATGRGGGGEAAASGGGGGGRGAGSAQHVRRGGSLARADDNQAVGAERIRMGGRQALMLERDVRDDLPPAVMYLPRARHYDTSDSEVDEADLDSYDGLSEDDDDDDDDDDAFVRMFNQRLRDAIDRHDDEDEEDGPGDDDDHEGSDDDDDDHAAGEGSDVEDEGNSEVDIPSEEEAYLDYARDYYAEDENEEEEADLNNARRDGDDEEEDDEEEEEEEEQGDQQMQDEDDDDDDEEEEDEYDIRPARPRIAAARSSRPQVPAVVINRAGRRQLPRSRARR